MESIFPGGNNIQPHSSQPSLCKYCHARQVSEVHGPFCLTPCYSQPSATLLSSLTHRDSQTFDFRDCCRASVLHPDNAHALDSCSFTCLKFFSMAKVFQALPVPPLLHKMQGSCATLQLLDTLHLSAAFTQGRIHCNFYTSWSLCCGTALC